MAQVPGSIQVEIPSWISRGGQYANSFEWLVSQYGGRSSDRLSTIQMRAICDSQVVPQACKATLKHQISGLNWYLAKDEEGDEPLDRKDKVGQHYYSLLDNWMDDEGNVIGFSSGVDLLSDDILTAREGGCNEVIRDKNGVAQYVLHVDASTIRFTHDNEHPVFQVSPWGEMTEAWEAERFMQVRWHPNPKIGASLSSRSPVQLAYSAIAILAGTDTYNWKIVAEPIPAGILNLGPGFNAERAKQWKASWESVMQGINPEPLAILYGTPNLDYKAFRPPPRDMAFETTDHWYASLVAACFEMSILDISILTKVATKAAAEEQAEATKRQGLRQLMRKIREAIENHLLEDGIFFIWEDIDPTDEKAQADIASKNTDMVTKWVQSKLVTEEQAFKILQQLRHIPDNVKYDAKAFEERRQQMQEQMKPKEEKGAGEEEEQEGEGGEEEAGEKEKGEEGVGKSVEKFIAKIRRKGWELSENQDPSLALNPVAKDGNQYLCEIGPNGKFYVFKKQDLEKLVKRQAKEEPLPSLDDDDEWWAVDEAYTEELAARVGKSVEKGGKGSGWHAPPKGTHVAGAKAGAKGIKGGKIDTMGTNLNWDAPDTITGTVVIETDNDFDTGKATKDQVGNFIKEKLAASGTISHIHSTKDIEDVKVLSMDTGKGYIAAEVDITPTGEAGGQWEETEFETEQWQVYHEFSAKEKAVEEAQEETTKAQDLEKLVKRQAKEEPLPSLDDDDEWWAVDEAYTEELAARVKEGMK